MMFATTFYRRARQSLGPSRVVRSHVRKCCAQSGVTSSQVNRYWHSSGHSDPDDSHVVTNSLLVPLYASVSRERRRCSKRGKRAVKTPTTSCRTRGRRQPSTHPPTIHRSSYQNSYWLLYRPSRRLFSTRIHVCHSCTFNFENWRGSQLCEMPFEYHKNCYIIHTSVTDLSRYREIFYENQMRRYSLCVKLIKSRIFSSST